MLIPTRLFGPVDVAVDDILRFPEGLLGFTGVHRFVLLDTTMEGAYWLQSADEGNLAFLVIEPEQFFPDYAPRFQPEVTIAPGDRFLAIVTLPRDGESATANLQAPVIINPVRRTGRQAVVFPVDYDTRHEFRLAR